MNARLLAAYALIAIAFVLVVLFATGTVEPFGSTSEARGLGGVLTAAAPSLLVPLAMFIVGVILLKGAGR